MTSPSSSPSPCYCSRLRAAARRLSAAYDEALAPLGITIGQFQLVRAIARRGDISLTELGRVAELDRSTVGRNVRVLIRQGLVAFSGSDDHRETAVRLTDHGTDVLAAAVPLWAACQAGIEQRIGDERAKALDELFAIL